MAGQALSPATAVRFELPDGSWGTGIGIAVCFGAIGGAVAMARERREAARRPHATSDLPSQRPARATPYGVLADVVTSASVGAATAVCGLFVVLLSPLTGGLGDGAFWAFLAAVSSALGIASDRILPTIQHNIFKKLSLLEDQVASTKASLQENAGLDQVERALEDALSMAAVPSVVEHGRETAQSYLSAHPRPRRPTLRLGRLYFEKLSDKDKAIETLTRFIDFLEGQPEKERDGKRPEDLAAGYYNRACYILNAPGPNDGSLTPYVPSPPEIDRALADLDRAFELNPKDKKDALADRDLAWLRANSAKFRTLLE